MGLNWRRNDYFSALMSRDKRAHAALEMMVDDLHTDKEPTINRFLTHPGSEDFLWGLIKLLGSNNARVAGNAAYILGTLAETEAGCLRVIELTESRSGDARRILADLTSMLQVDDAESVMNAAGTMGTLAESVEGRSWMLREPCIEDTMTHVTSLLHNNNMWTASNAALVLARLTISESGCERVLSHPRSTWLLTALVSALGTDEAGRGMNAAFAIGRLCDLGEGRQRLLSLQDSEKMISSLSRMLCCSDPGASKNACFALSCLATTLDGHGRLLRNPAADDVVRTLAGLLASQDAETGWFAAMTLRTLAAQPKGCLRLRDHGAVLPALKAMASSPDAPPDLLEEVTQTLAILARLEKPAAPRVSETAPGELSVEWEESTTRSGLQIRYQLFLGERCVYQGCSPRCVVPRLRPFTEYSLRLRAVTDGDESPASDTVTVTTDEAEPGPPTNLRVLGCTTTQLKVGWEPPAEPNGVLKGYYVYSGDRLIEHTAELSAILTGLQPSTQYEVSVCAATTRGRGPRESVSGNTAEMGAHAPSKPEVAVRGRSELHVSWRAPAVPLGRITRYDVTMNGAVVYSGTELHCVAQRLKADTEYKCVVVAITGEGRFESKSSKKRTAKDEFEGERAPLYQPPSKEPEKKDEPAPAPPKKQQRRKSVSGEPKSRSASASSAKAKLRQTVREAKSAKHRQKTEMEVTKPEPKPVEKPVQPKPKPIEKPKEKPKPVEKPKSEPPPPPVVVAPVKKETPVPEGRALTEAARQPHNTPTVSEADYSRYERVTPTPDQNPPAKAGAKNLPKPKPPASKVVAKATPATRRSRGGQGSPALDHNKNHSRHGNDVLTVEISDRKPPGSLLGSRPVTSGSRRASSDSAGGEDSGLLLSRRRQNKHTADSAGDVEPAAPPSDRVRNHDRYEADITRTFSTLNFDHYRPPAVVAAQHTSIMEFNPPIPTGAGAPSHVQRANTFIAMHSSKGGSGGGGNSRRAVLPPPPSAAHQWKPEFPHTSQQVKPSNKFVPMQFRTQPANLPGGPVTRQRSNMHDLGVRSRTSVTGFGHGLLHPQVAADYHSGRDLTPLSEPQPPDLARPSPRQQRQLTT